jgi:hypothetical protein
VNALRRVHSALVRGGLVVDTQPVSPHPPVEAGGERLGALDMREWAGTIAAVDELTATTFDEGLFSIEHERSFVVSDTFDSGADFLDVVPEWRGTDVSDDLRRCAEAAKRPLSVHQDIRLRLLRALDPA